MYGTKAGELIGKTVENLKNVNGVEFVAVAEKRGDPIAIAGDTGMNVDELLTRTSMIYSTFESGGKKLEKGDVEEIDIIWDNGMCILKTLNVDYTLHVITSRDAISWVRPVMKTVIEAIQKIVGR